MEKLMYLKNKGKYRLYKTLAGIDYAMIFVCVDERGNYLLLAEMDSNEEFEEWVAVDLSNDKLIDLLTNKITIQQAFINCDITKYYRIRHLFNNDSYSLCLMDSMPSDVISSKPFYVGVDVEKENQNLIYSAVEAYKKRGLSVLDLHFNPYTDNHKLPVGFLATILDSIKRIYNSVTKTRKDNLDAELIPASFLIRFQSSLPEQFLEKNSSSYALGLISKIVSSPSVEPIFEDMKENPTILKSSKELINSLAKENKSFDVIYARDENEVTIKNVNNKDIISLNNELKDLVIEEDQTEVYCGTLDGYDTKRKTFSFTTKTGKLIKGKLDASFMIAEHVVPSECSATIKTCKIYDVENSKSKDSFFLINIKQ